MDGQGWLWKHATRWLEVGASPWPDAVERSRPSRLHRRRLARKLRNGRDTRTIGLSGSEDGVNLAQERADVKGCAGGETWGANLGEDGDGCCSIGEAPLCAGNVSELDLGHGRKRASPSAAIYIRGGWIRAARRVKSCEGSAFPPAHCWSLEFSTSRHESQWGEKPQSKRNGRRRGLHGRCVS